jgi:hypothetical protein
VSFDRLTAQVVHLPIKSHGQPEPFVLDVGSVKPHENRKRSNARGRAGRSRSAMMSWIGGGAIICPGVTIGASAVIGASSVVTGDMPAGMLAAGNPCRVIRPIEAETAASPS